MLAAMRRHFAWTLLAALAVGAAQKPAPAPAFEAATVKPIAPGERTGPGGTVRFEPTRVSANFINAQALIATAYGVKSSQITGLPEWCSTELYELAATTDYPTDQITMVRMLRTLLSERFRLQAHSETRNVTYYALIVAPGGSKLTPVTPPAEGPLPADAQAKLLHSLPPLPAGMLRRINTGQTWQFAQLLATWYGINDHPIVDETGIAGTYLFHVDLDPSLMSNCGEGCGQPLQLSSGEISELLEQQLGLRLELRKNQPLEELVVDHIERPIPN